MFRVKRWRGALKIVGVNLAIFALLAELVGVGAYWYRTKTLYYTNRPSGKEVAEALEGTVEGFRIHPYLGFIVLPDTHDAGDTNGTLAYNNFGFITPFDYPYLRREPGEILVGIFGGSVAAHLAIFERYARVLSARLAPHWGVAPDAIRILNFGQGGFKQPQQLLLLNYLGSLGQELDLIINIDGFNEVALGAINLQAGVAVDMPSLDHMRALQEVTAVGAGEGLESMVAARRAWRGYSRAYNRAWSGTAWETNFASGFLVDWMRYRYHHKRYLDWRLSRVEQEQDTTQAGASWLFLNDAPRSDGLDWTALIDVWARSSRAMYTQARAAGIPYLHVIQPNQYHDTGRQFSAEERAVAIADRTPYGQPVVEGYPRLAEAIPALRAEGVPVYELYELFDDVPEAVYVDNCCHYNETGQHILASRIGDLLLEQVAKSAEGESGSGVGGRGPQEP